MRRLSCSCAHPAERRRGADNFVGATGGDVRLDLGTQPVGLTLTLCRRHGLIGQLVASDQARRLCR